MHASGVNDPSTRAVRECGSRNLCFGMDDTYRMSGGERKVLGWASTDMIRAFHKCLPEEKHSIWSV